MIERYLGENMRILRKQHGLTQSQAAEKAGISVRNWQRVETTENWPPPDTIRAIAKVFNVSETRILADPSASTHEAADLVSERAEMVLKIVTSLSALKDRELSTLLAMIDIALKGRSAAASETTVGKGEAAS